MANYKEENISGTKWTRCNKLVINNPYLGDKIINFFEEEITEINGSYINNKADGINLIFNDPSKIINIINSTTGVSTGNTITFGEIYEILHSLYIQLATERDSN